MKLRLSLVVWVLSAVSIFAQGQVFFQNSTIVTPVTMSLPGELMPAGGQVYSFQFLYGTSAGNLNYQSPVFFNHDSLNGRIAGGTVTLETPAEVPTFFQFRAWSTAYGSFEASSINGGIAYISPLIVLTPSSSPNPPTPMFGTTPGSSFQGFYLVAPEPSTYAIAGLAGVACLLMRRKRTM